MFDEKYDSRRKRVADAIADIVPTASDYQLTELVYALEALIDDKTSDLEDKINETGQWSRDY